MKFNLSSNSELIAHFISSKQDEDEDGLADWYEMNQFGDLNQNSKSDPDFDGYPNGKEVELGQTPMIHDLVEDGGISFASSQISSFVSDELIMFSIKSQPVGISEESSGALVEGSPLSTPNLLRKKRIPFRLLVTEWC